MRTARGLAISLRLQRGLGVAAVLAVGAAVTSQVQGPRPADRLQRPQHSAPPAAWREIRATLAEAHECRRAGRHTRALTLYRSVLEAPRARPQDRDQAGLWSARIRLEFGEASALLELERLVASTDEPHLIASAALAVQRWQASRSKRARARHRLDEDALVLRVVTRAKQRLRSLAKLATDEGARAMRWSEHLDPRLAEIFSE